MPHVQLGFPEHRPVQVRLDGGLWVDGWLEAHREVEGVWWGHVRYTTWLAETRVEWFEERRIRPGATW